MVRRGTGRDAEGQRARVAPAQENANATILDMKGRLAANAPAWHRRLDEALTRTWPQRNPSLAKQWNIPLRTLQAWRNISTEIPQLSSMLWLHERGVYTLSEQIMDLCGLKPGDLEPTAPVWEPEVSLSAIKEALDRALGRSVATMPTLQEVTSRIEDTCAATRNFGRWRSRSFEMPMGWQFPHLGFRGVEFLPWYGPGQEIDPEPDLRKQFLELDELGSNQWFRGEITERFFDPTVPPAFLPVGSPMSEAEAWNQCRLERMELVKRMGSLHASSQAIWFGAYGTVHAPLLWHGANGRLSGRHLFVQPIDSPPLPETGIPDLFVGSTPVRTILILGTSALPVARIGQLVADALGWLGLDYRLYTQRLLGRRVALSLTDQPDRDPRALTHLQRPRTMPMVMYCNLNYLTVVRDGEPHPRPEALDLLAQADVLPLLLTHDDHEVQDTSYLWHMRQQTASWDGVTVAGFSNESLNRSLIDRWIDVFKDLVPNGVIAELQPTIPWSGPGTTRPGLTAPEWFSHPLVGDIQVRAAYEIASWLRGKPVPESKPNLNRVDFARDSVVHQYASELRRCTGGDFLTGGLTEFEKKYLHAPKEAPPTGRVIWWLQAPRRPSTVRRRTTPVTRRS